MSDYVSVLFTLPFQAFEPVKIYQDHLMTIDINSHSELRLHELNNHKDHSPQ